MLDLDPSLLTASILFGIVGMGYYRYGKKQNLYFLFAGVALIIYPYFIDTLIPMIMVGVIIMLIPFILNKLDL